KGTTRMNSSRPPRRCTARWTCGSGWSRQRRSYKPFPESGGPKEATMAGQDNLHVAREIFAAWNAHDVEGFVKRLDTKTAWESDVFPAPFSGHEGARHFFKVYLTAFPDLHLPMAPKCGR